MIRPQIFQNLQGLIAGFTTREFTAMDEDVDAARRRLAPLLGFDGVASAGQVHGDEVTIVKVPGHSEACDALITTQSELLLTVVSADCALVLLADPVSGVIAACHSGWRGTVGQITSKAVDEMLSLGAMRARIRVYISPCISAAAFEVGDEVADHFDDAVVIRRPEWPKPHVDLKAEIFRQLTDAGVNEANIEIDHACTASEPKRFYSYRAENGTTGRMIGFIGYQFAGPGSTNRVA